VLSDERNERFVIRADSTRSTESCCDSPDVATNGAFGGCGLTNGALSVYWHGRLGKLFVIVSGHSDPNRVGSQPGEFERVPLEYVRRGSHPTEK
jgi:hypothetical protein